MKRLLVRLRKAVTPERDVFARLVAGIVALPAMTAEDERYFRDVYDHPLLQGRHFAEFDGNP